MNIHFREKKLSLVKRDTKSYMFDRGRFEVSLEFNFIFLS
jgi:hypothetical protein